MKITYVLRLSIILLMCQLYSVVILNSQDNISKSSFYAAKFSYGIGIPQHLMRQQYGNYNRISLAAQYTSSRWQLGLNGGLNFGGNVATDPFSEFRNSNGQILGVQGDYTSVFYRYRARSMGCELGYFIGGELESTNRFMVLADLNYQESYIRFLNDDGGFPILDTKQHLLYDQLRKGIGWATGLGYQYRFPKREFRVSTSIKYRWQQANRSSFRSTNEIPHEALFQSIEWSIALIFPFFQKTRNKTIYY